MDKLREDSVDWAVTHIRRYGDTDIFPVPFEYEAIRHAWPKLRAAICDMDMSSYECRPFRRMLVPKQGGSYRVAIQLDPIDTIVYTALAYEAAHLIEEARIPVERRIACSYRVEAGPQGELFRKNNGWDDFHSVSRELAQSGDYEIVVTADIADFYNQIGHHRVRNALELAGVEAVRAKNIENVLMNLTRGQSQGIPIGPSASAIFSEACLSDVDHLILRKGYVHTRYVDDFRIFCRDIREAHRALHDLTEYLYTAHRLPLQTQKTKIFPAEEFVQKELVDPEELENRSKEEKLEALQEFFNQYREPDDDEEPDLDSLVRNNLVELFEACIQTEPMHLGTAKYILRRATALGTGVLRELVLDNMGCLAPVMREVSQYVLSTTSQAFSEQVGRRFIEGCNTTDYGFLPFVQSWLLHVLQTKMVNALEDEIVQLSRDYRNDLGIRPFALLAREKHYLDWVREQKETWANNTPWDRRAVIWSATALSRDEMNYWLKRVQNAGDILDRAIAESVLNTVN